MVSFLIGGALLVGSVLTSPMLYISITAIALTISGICLFQAFFNQSQIHKLLTFSPQQKIKLPDGRLLEGPYKVLGEGAFGKVMQYKLEGKWVAVKMPLNSEYDKLQQKELALLRKANSHAHIIKLLADVKVKQQTWIVMEFMQGSLRDLLDKFPNLSWKTKLSIAIQITKGIVHLHNLTGALFDRKAIIHQDLKTANILVNQLTDSPKIEAKIGDFGLARELDHITLPLVGTVASRIDKGHVGGTLTYSAPEIASALITGKGYGSIKCDIFSLGIILWELATGCKPKRTEKEVIQGRFDDFTSDANHKRKVNSKSFLGIKNHALTKPTYPKSAFFGPVIRKCIKKEPSNRYSASEVLDALEKISL